MNEQVTIETRPFGFDTAASELDRMAMRVLDPAPVYEAILQQFPGVVGQAFGGSPDLIDTGEMHDAFVGHPDHAFSPDAMSIGSDEQHAHYWWIELLAPFEAVAGTWADMFLAHIVAGSPGTAMVGVIGA